MPIGQVLGQNSIYVDGNWLKVPVTANSVIRLTYTDIENAGLSLADIDPATIQVFGNGAGMLPQANDSSTFVDPQEVAIKVVTAQAGSFAEGDYILFYAEGPDYIRYDRQLAGFYYQHHLYSDVNYYYLTVGQDTGKRIKNALPTSPGSLLEKGVKYFVHEQDLYNILHSGREWYGEKFDLELSLSIPTTMTNLAAGSEVRIYSSVMSSSLATSSFDLYINEVLAGSQQLPANPLGTYARKGITALDNFSVNQSALGQDPLTVKYEFNKTSGLGYLDYFMLEAEVNLHYSEDPLLFYTGPYTETGNKTINITNCPMDISIWDISNPGQTYAISYNLENDVASFNIADTTETIIAFRPGNLSYEGDITTIENQDIKTVSQVDLLIITTAEFRPYAEEIRDIRGAEGLSAIVVTDEEIYNEFSSGKKDITAIRNYARYLYENAGLNYLLMFGKGTYDPKNFTATNMEVLPIYQSRNSLFPLATYASDDYLGFMEDHEGYWAENGDDDHTMDIGVGRVPVASVTEAVTYVEKLRAYQSKSALGNWRQKVVFIAENGDGNIHQRDAERLAALIDTTYEAFTTKKIYVDAYPIDVMPGGNRAPEVNNEIYDAINAGALIVNYTGHGNTSQWANTNIFNKQVIDTLLNDRYFPLFVTATCEFGRHDHTGLRSGGEELLLKKETGAIATITTARPVFASSNYQLNKAFYNSVFERQGGYYQRLGDIFRDTKNNSLNSVLNRNFSLLGDPSMRLSYGQKFIRLDSLNGKLVAANDTLKALEWLEFSGTIRNSIQDLDDTFNGVVEVKILDQSQSRQTLGNLGNSPFTYNVRDNILFSGSASIQSGRFSFSTILPKDISYDPETARVVMYASRVDSTSDASGANIDFLIGGSSSTTINDVQPPEVTVYINDTTFTEGDIVNESSLLVIRLKDNYGINTSISQVGHSITFQLDDHDPVVLNSYYNTLKDDFTTGWIYFNLPTMTAGRHTLKVTAWDTSNNSTNETIEFYVASQNQVVISELSNFPNPMTNNTIFTFSHNLGGDDIEVRLEIINTSGQKIYTETRHYTGAPNKIADWTWDGRNSSGGKLIAGIYIYGVFIRSISSGNVQNQFSRLFISN